MLDAEVSSVRMLWVGLSGSLDGSSWDLLHGCAKEVAAEGGVVIDLRRLDSVDEAGLAAVRQLADTLHALDRELVMVSGPAIPSGAAGMGQTPRVRGGEPAAQSDDPVSPRRRATRPPRPDSASLNQVETASSRPALVGSIQVAPTGA